MQVELGADRHLRPDDGADAGEQVAFGVVVALGDHGAVQVDQHGIDRQRLPQVVQDLVAEGFVDVPQGRGRGLG